MSVTFDAQSTADSTANGVTSITSTNLTVGSGANRGLLALIEWSGVPTSITMNWDQLGTPQALAAVTGATGTLSTTQHAEVWGLVNPTAGAKQLKASWTGAKDVTVAGVSYIGVDQTGGATSFPHGTGATASTTGTVTVFSMTSATGNACVAGVGSNSSLSVPTQTVVYTDNSPASTSGAAQRATGAASVAFGWTFTGTSGWAAAGCDILAAGAGPAFMPTPNHPVMQAVSRASYW